MQRTTVDSSSIAEIGFEAETQTLEIAFNDGSVYLYFGVAVALRDALIESDSKGKFFNEKIRNRYAFVRVR